MTDSRSDANDSDKGRDCQRDPAKDPQIRRAELQMFFDADTGKTAKKECRRVMGRDKDGKILANEHGHGNVMSTGGKFFTDTQDEGHEPKEERVRAQHHADGTRQGANEIGR